MTDFLKHQLEVYFIENPLEAEKIGNQVLVNKRSREKAEKALRQFLRPEFISRVDEVVFFRPLSREDFVAIARLMLEELVEPLSQRGIAFGWTEDALTALADAAHGGKRGARDLRNVTRRQVENVLAAEIVATTSLLSLVTMFLWVLALRGMGYC